MTVKLFATARAAATFCRSVSSFAPAEEVAGGAAENRLRELLFIFTIAAQIEPVVLCRERAA